jgi:hypothetical protein
MNRHKCGNCVYWRPEYGERGADFNDYDAGRCRRHAPMLALVVTTSSYGAVSPKWPVMGADGWCGDYSEYAFPPAR